MPRSNKQKKIFTTEAGDLVDRNSVWVMPMYPVEEWEKSGKKEGKESGGSAFKERKFEIRSKPTDARSNKVGAHFRVINGSATAETYCQWRDDFETLCVGINAISGSDRAATVRLLMEGQPLDDFERYLRDSVQGEPTKEEVDKALKYVAIGLFPADAVLIQKAYLNHEAKKHNDQKVRQMVHRLKQLNDWFSYYPSDGGDRLDEVVKLGERELTAIFYNRLMPRSWKQKLDEQTAISPFIDPLAKVVDYAERLETSKWRYSAKGSRSATSINAQHNRSNRDSVGGSHNGGPEVGPAKRGETMIRNNNRKAENPRDCRLHGENCGHSTHNCKVLMNHAKDKRAQWATHPSYDKRRAANNRRDRERDERKRERASDRTDREVHAIKRKRDQPRAQENHRIEPVAKKWWDMDTDDDYGYSDIDDVINKAD